MAEGPEMPKATGVGTGGRKSGTRTGGGTPKTGRPASGAAKAPRWSPRPAGSSGSAASGRGRPAPKWDRPEPRTSRDGQDSRPGRGAAPRAGAGRDGAAGDSSQRASRPPATDRPRRSSAPDRGRDSAPRGTGEYRRAARPPAADRSSSTGRPSAGDGDRRGSRPPAGDWKPRTARPSTGDGPRRTGRPPAADGTRHTGRSSAGDARPPQARVRPQGTGSPAPHVRRPVTVPAVPGVLQRPMTSVVPAGRLMLAPARARAPGPSAGIGRSAPASGQPGEGPASIEGRGRVPQRAGSGEAPPAADAGPGMRLRAVRRARIAHEAATGRRNAGRATRPGPGLTRSQAEVPGSRAPTEKAPRAGRRTAVVSASRTPSPRSNSILTHVPS